jgi:hypothetical protein
MAGGIPCIKWRWSAHIEEGISFESLTELLKANECFKFRVSNLTVR